MKNKNLIKIFILSLFFILPSFAEASCISNYQTEIKSCQLINGTIHIPGGVNAYTIATSNKEYILDGDLSVDGTAITINASNIVLNLNGHTITYNNKITGCGVLSGGYNLTNVAITNGSIVQGSARTDGATCGLGSNPIRFHSGTPNSYNVANVQIANVNAKYYGKDLSAFHLGGNGHLVENNTIEDVYDYGTLMDRHLGVAAVKMWGSLSTVRLNTIINARHRGIDAGSFDDIYGNNITIRSMATNSIGIFSEGAGVKIHDNKIYGRGEHPIGIAVHNSALGASYDNEVYKNEIDVKTTRLGLEYGSYPIDPVNTISEADFAVGIRSTSGTQNLLVHDNLINVYSESDFAGNWSPDGRQVRISAGARGIMTGLRYNSQSARYYNNTINAIDKDGKGYAGGIVCDSNIDNNNFYIFNAPAADFSPNLIFYDNKVASNVYNIVMGDKYGPCSGNPLFVRNTIAKAGSFDSYATYASGLGGYFEGTGKMISNIYQNGASENSLQMHFESLSNNVSNVGGSYKNKSMIFGHLNEGKYLVYDYTIHNNGGTTGSSTPISVTLNEIGSQFLFGNTNTADTAAPSAPSGLNIQ